MPDRLYQELSYNSPDETLAEIASGEPDRVTRALLGAALESADPSWVEACAISLSLADDNALRRASLLTLGHLARRFRRPAGPALAAVLRRLEADEDLAPVVAELRDDLAVYGLSLIHI